jgi:hypothetical protein
MSTSEKPQKISIGFRGGQVLAARVKSGDLTKLQEVLGKSDGWHALAAEDGTIMLDPTRIDYVLVESDDHRIGF